MESQTESDSSALENQLRGMILGNVRITNGQTNQQAHHAQRGRGRGRGGPWRGNRNHQHHPEQGQEQQNYAPHSGQPRRGRGNNFNNQGYHPHVPQGSTYTQGSASSQRGSLPNVGRQQTPRHPRQTTHVQGPSMVQLPPNASAPKVLQRPHHNAHPPTQGQVSPSSTHHPQPQAPYRPRPHFNQPQEDPVAQAVHLDNVAADEIPKVEMTLAEFEEKEAFRQHLEGILRQAFADGYSGDIATISLVGFGSLASGFGMPGSDMDLAIVPEWKDPSKVDQIGIDRSIPRLLERAILDAKLGGRLLTRTRVPILKVCQSPNEELYTALFNERSKWDELSEEEKYPTEVPPEPAPAPKPTTETEGDIPGESTLQVDNKAFGDDFPELGSMPKKKEKKKKAVPEETTTEVESMKVDSPTISTKQQLSEPTADNPQNKQQQPRVEKVWVREKVLGPLDFPKHGVGIQCDINFENPLGIHNTHMLRCYSLTDPRVRPIVLFVKSWAKRRKINSSYSGTLSSYGWVLMVLHYLVNVAQPPVCPNLQNAIPQPKDLSQLENFFKDRTIAGYTVRFWRNEQEIIEAAQAGQLSQNRQTIGGLLRGFFQYYASLSAYGYGPRPPQFYWTNEVLSLRTPGGIRSKQDKGWVSAKTTVTAEKKVTNRYLFAIEDPFELDHNVARTVTHRGIVAIRDDFRRAWRILSAIGKGLQPEGGLFDEVVENVPPMLKEGEADGVKKMGMEDVGVKNDGQEIQSERQEPVETAVGV